MWKGLCNLCILVLISCLLCDNHAVMGNTITMPLLNIVWITMHAYLVWSKRNLPWVEKIGICILLEKNIGPPTKAMFTCGSFSWTKVQTSVVLVFPVWMSKKLRFIKIEKSNEIHLLGPLYRRQGGTPLWHLVKTYVCDENPWKSKLIRTRCEHY